MIYKIGLIGARGYAGQALLKLIAQHPKLELAFAASRSDAGKRVGDVVPDVDGNTVGDVVFISPTPESCAKIDMDIAVLAMPDGFAAGYVAAIDAICPDVKIVDLGADYRGIKFDDHHTRIGANPADPHRIWQYGLPELYNHDGRLNGATRIANPGCYATAIQMSVYPIKEALISRPAVFGVSGYSGAGTTPSPKNDPDNLRDNLLPYALTGHNHELESSLQMGVDVSFTPHVHPAFDGIVTTTHLQLDPNGGLSRHMFMQYYHEMIANCALVQLSENTHDLRAGSETNGILLHGFGWNEDRQQGVVLASMNNLLKGAAVQAMQNINLALGMDEHLGILIGY